MSTLASASTPNLNNAVAQKKARTLVGWLPSDEGAKWIAGRQHTTAPNPAHVALCQKARDAVGKRLPGCDQSMIFKALPPELGPHLALLQSHPRSAQLLAEGGVPRMVDIRSVCAAQPTINIEDAVARVNKIQASDLLGLAQLTLPTHGAAPMPYIYDHTKNAWILSSPNLNLRVVGPFTGEVKQGATGFGFAVEVTPSYVQIVGVGGRYFLLDGYHRIYGLLASGIYWVPALVREYASIEQVNLPKTLLPPATYLGDRPPRLVDYLDTSFSADTLLPATTKMVLIQAIEIASLACT
jgi:hypothetical protein